MVKAKGQYVYESEKGNMHNQLLKQINQGIKLKQVKTNDRSKPNLDGLRKFRRQMTIEEQIQKSMSQANMSSTNLSELKEVSNPNMRMLLLLYIIHMIHYCKQSQTIILYNINNTCLSVI